MEVKIIRTMLRGSKKQKMKKEKKLKIMAVIFMTIIFGVALLTAEIVNWKAISGLVGLDWLTQNTGLLAMCRIEWWQHHNLFIIVQVIATLFIGIAIIAIIWATLFFVPEILSIASYLILAKKYDLGYVEMYMQDEICTLYFEDYHLFGVRSKEGQNVFKYFSRMIGFRIIFLVLSPLIIPLWIIKWCAGGLYFGLKMAV